MHPTLPKRNQGTTAGTFLVPIFSERSTQVVVTARLHPNCLRQLAIVPFKSGPPVLPCLGAADLRGRYHGPWRLVRCRAVSLQPVPPDPSLLA